LDGDTTHAALDGDTTHAALDGETTHAALDIPHSRNLAQIILSVFYILPHILNLIHKNILGPSL
jgi:hypothetical protein